MIATTGLAAMGKPAVLTVACKAVVIEAASSVRIDWYRILAKGQKVINMIATLLAFHYLLTICLKGRDKKENGQDNEL